MGKLHEILAVEANLQGQFNKILQEAIVTFSKKEHLFAGFHKTCQMFDDDAANDAPPDERSEMSTTVDKKLAYIKEPIVRYLDCCLQKEATNQLAVADLVVDGKVIAEKLPATFLLGLETRLNAIREVYATVPTLAPGTKWIEDPAKGEGVFSAEHPEQTMKTKKVIRNHIRYEATKEHPAQVDTYSETINVGKFTKNTWSGLITPAKKAEIMGRIDKLLIAVKKARQRANGIEVKKTHAASVIINYINEGVVKPF